MYVLHLTGLTELNLYLHIETELSSSSISEDEKVLKGLFKGSLSSKSKLQVSLYTSIKPVRTCVNLEVHPEVAGITKSLAAVFTLVRLHPHMPHEVHIKLSGRNEGP